LAPRFYCPFTILRKLGAVTYELDLPPFARIHLVFHVSQLKLKLKLGSSTTSALVLLLVDADGIIQPEPEEVLLYCFRPKHNCSIMELLIPWVGESYDDATWEEYHALKQAYPHLMGKVL